MRFSRMRREAGRLERDLRAERPEPRADFVLSLTKEVAASRPRSRRSPSRVAFSLALLTFVVGTFASFGGVGYAAEGAGSAVNVMKQAAPRVLSGSSAQQQYGPQEQPAAEEESAAAPAAQVAGAEGLPFTGISLAVTAALGLLLLAAGLILRRAERRLDRRS
jgi:hypothetical protein